MTKPERIEDLGRIRELLTQLIDSIDDTWGRKCDSKHDFETFQAHLKEHDNLYDLHCILRQHKDKITDIYHLSCGDLFD